VRPIAFDPHAEVPYLVTEYVPGTSLRTLIQKGPMKVDDTINVLQQARGLVDGGIFAVHKPVTNPYWRASLRRGVADY